MRSNFLSVAALVFASLSASVQAGESHGWYAVSNGTDFLDSDKGVIITSDGQNVDTVNAGHDKGMRFWWGGDSTNVENQAHENRFLGYDASNNNFRADNKQNDHGPLVVVTINPANPAQAKFCNGNKCIGAGAISVTNDFWWDFATVGQA